MLIGLNSLRAVSHIEVGVFLYLLVIGVVLESLPIPAGKVLSTLTPVIPVTVLITQGSDAAILIMLLIAAIAMMIQGGSRKFSTRAFNVGQYTISVGAMSLVFHAIVGTQYKESPDWLTLFALIMVTLTFAVVNHFLVHVHNYIRDMFDWRDVRNILNESSYYLLTLPIVMLMIALEKSLPLFSSLTIIPIIVLGYVLRIYRKGSLMQRVQQTTARLVSEFDVEKVSMEVATAASRLSYSDLVVIHLLSENGRVLSPLVVYPESRKGEMDANGIDVSQGGVIWNVLNSSPDCECEYVPDTSRDERVVSDGVSSRWYRSMAVYPIRTHGATHGAIVCYAERAHAYSELTEYVVALTSQFGVLLENAKLYQQLREQSHRDGATGLYNYRYFYEFLATRLKQAKDQKQPLSVAILDVDHFKALNDTYGHLAGDEVLRSLAQLFQTYAGKDALVARYGGEEFVFVYNWDVETVRVHVDRIRQAVADHTVTVDQYQIQGITVSAGIAGYPDDSSDDRDLLAKADSALYWGAKERGRNRTALYNPEFDADLFVDKLTGLYTLHYAAIRLREEVQNGTRDWGAICFDVERLVAINNSLGFDIGDEVLKQISGVIRDHVRQSEIACRFGGDEFVILMADATEREVELVADRLAKAVASHHFALDSTVILPVRCRHAEVVISSLQDATAFFDRINRTFAGMHAPSANDTAHGRDS